MLHGATHPGMAGSELTRLLARMADTPTANTQPAFAERLGHWLGWTGAIALSTTLGAGPAPAQGGRIGQASEEEAAFRRVRAGLEAAIAAGPREPVPSPADFAPYRRHGVAMQHAMQQDIGALRARLRGALARRSPTGARLAAMDAVLDQHLAAQERSLLGLVMLRLQSHFENLQSRGDPESWPGVFRHDMDQLLRAELAHRLLPARGLLDTLHSLELK